MQIAGIIMRYIHQQSHHQVPLGTYLFVRRPQPVPPSFLAPISLSTPLLVILQWYSAFVTRTVSDL